MYGVGFSTIGMISAITTGVAICAYCPTSDSVVDIAEMDDVTHIIRQRTDALDVVGNTMFPLERKALPVADGISIMRRMGNDTQRHIPLSSRLQLNQQWRLLQIARLAMISEDMEIINLNRIMY